MKCLDTYALVEINNGNPAFASLLNENVIITDITLAEFYAHIYRKYDLRTAEYWKKKLSFLCTPVSRETLVKAVRFRIDNNALNLSFFDCVGYLFALESGRMFVTGDRAFRRMRSVEFIK